MVPVRRVNRRVPIIAARQLAQATLAILLKIQRQHLKQPILDSAAEIRLQSLHSKMAKLSWILVRELALIVFLPLVLLAKPEE